MAVQTRVTGHVVCSLIKQITEHHFCNINIHLNLIRNIIKQKMLRNTVSFLSLLSQKHFSLWENKKYADHEIVQSHDEESSN